MHTELTIGGLSAETGVNIETIRYYERIGVMPEPPRLASGHRRYGEAHLRRLSFVKRGRELGFSLDELRGLLKLVDQGNYKCGDVRDEAMAHLRSVDEKLKALRALRKRLNAIISRCEDAESEECPFIDTLFEPLPR